MKFILYLVALGLFTPAAGGARPPVPDRPIPMRPPGKLLVSPENLMNSVKWLSHDDRAGRMTASEEERIAAEWIAARFQEYGLVPAGDDGGFHQRFEVALDFSLGDHTTALLEGSDFELELELGSEFTPFSFSENGEIAAPLIFVGYGITAPEWDYDDYAGIDVAGKVVLVLRHEPQKEDAGSVFSGDRHSPHAFFRNKAENAVRHGAVGMILFTGPKGSGPDEDNLVPLRRSAGLEEGPLLAVQTKRRTGERLLEQAGVRLEDWVEAVDQDLAPRSFAFDKPIIARLSVNIEKRTGVAANVVGILPGTDPTAGAVILGAHYDHLGRGNGSSLAPGKIGEVHNGADDNASGTAALLELARIFSITEPLTRTLIFAAFSGEELGLLGSSYMASHPPVPLETVQAMLNMDMVGRPKNGKLTVGGVGTAAEFAPLLETVDEGNPLTLSTSESGVGPSDHTSFYLKDVPVLFFFSGLHSDYHKPGDDWEKIDREGLANATRAVHAVALDLANRPDQLALASAASDEEPSGGGGGVGYGPYLGTIPDFGDHEGGVLLAGVKEGSPAEKAGMREGDVVAEFDGRLIGDLYEYTEALRAHQPGDTVPIVVVRNGERVTLNATLARRD